MIKDNPQIEEFRVKPYSTKEDGNNGIFFVYFEGRELKVIASDGMDWDHVSVSLPNRCPNWKEMSFIKDLFFYENECVVQYHPPKSEYVNNHPYCLHLWRPQQFELPTPPSIMVGVKEIGSLLE